jgi:hypothetical protein
MGLFDNIKAGMQGFGQGFKSNVESNRATGEGFTDFRGTFDAQGKRVEGSAKPNLLQLAHGSMTDDKGLFQGGNEGRMFGRYKDFADNVNAGDSGLTLPGGKIPAIPNQKAPVTTVSTPDGQEVVNYTDPGDEARAFATTFDPSNPEQVFKMQNLLNKSGMMDWQGNTLSTDSQWGYKSQSALDFLRSGKYKPETNYGASVSGIQENPTESILNNPPAQSYSTTPIINADASNDFLGDPDPYGYNTTMPSYPDSSLTSSGGGGIGIDALMHNQFR